MKNQRAIYFLLSAIFFLGGCVSQRAAQLDAVLKSWIGQDINLFIASWRPPNHTYRLPNGTHILYAWNYYQPGVRSNVDCGEGYSMYKAYCEGAKRVAEMPRTCYTQILATAAGKIVSYKYEGNAC